jgi:transcriptional regulator with XRE-family HTH domain
MDEVDAGQSGVPPVASPRTVGETLRSAREAQGLSLTDVSARTRVPLRHLQAIEAGDYQSLPSPTYAVGFARAYARAVGADEVAAAQATRVEVDRLGRRQPEYEPYEVTDPARVPSRGIAIVAAGLALGLAILAGLWFGSDWFRGTSTPEIVSPVVATLPVPTPTRPPAPPTGGEVVLTAQDEVWLRVYDSANKTLYLGTMTPGERFVVPADANGPQINVGRPDKLAVTLNGAAVPPLGTGERPIKDVAVSGAAMAARLAGVPARLPTPTPSPSASAAALPPPFVPPAAAPAPAAERTVRRTPPRRRLTETQRANLESARQLRAARTNSRER